MTQLGEDARELIDRCRDADDPSPGDQARVRRKLAASLAAGAATATHAAAANALGAAGSASAAPAAFSAGKAATLLVGGLTIGVASAGLATAVLPSEEVRETPRVAPASTPEARRPDVAKANEGVHSSRASARAPEEGASDVARADQRLAAKDPPSAPRVASQAGSTTASTLAAETRLLQSARAALAGGDATRALALSSEHAARFPEGVLGEEATVTRLLALCRLGRTAEAETLARAFGASAPHSPLRARVQTSCAGPALSETD